MKRAVAAAALLLAAFACRAGGIRPRFGAAPHSILTPTPDSAATVIVHLAARAQELGLTIARATPVEGYLETGWYDVEKKQPTGEPFNGLDHIVKLRFFADPSQGHTRLLSESVRRIAWDPSVPQRDLERMVPDSTPGRALLDSVLTVIKPMPVDTTPAPVQAPAPPPSPRRP